MRFSNIEEIMSASLHSWLENVRRQCEQIHDGIREAYIDYPIEWSVGA